MRRLSAYFMLEERIDDTGELDRPGERGCRAPRRREGGSARALACPTHPDLLPLPLSRTGLEVRDGNVVWAEAPPKPQEPGKKGGPGGKKGASKRSLRRRGSVADVRPGSATPPTPPGEGEAQDGAVVVALDSMKPAEDGVAPAAAAESDKDSATESVPDTPPKGASPAGKEPTDKGKDGKRKAAWWLHDIQLEVGDSPRAAPDACARRSRLVPRTR